GSWQAVVTALLTVAAHHLGLFYLLPKSVFNYDATIGIVLLHAVFAAVAALGSGLVAKRFGAYIEVQELLTMKLEKSTQATLDLSKKLEAISSEIGQSGEEQSSSIEQTSSALCQIASMGESTYTRIVETRSIAIESAKVASSGRDSVSMTQEAMHSIEQSNSEMLSFVRQTNESLVEMTSIIGSIADKTKIIN